MNKLKNLESKIESGNKQAFEVGYALRQIRDEQLYKESYNTFKNYVEERWNITKSGAYQKIKCVDIKDIVPEVQNEYQATALSKIGTNKKKIRKIWAKAKRANKPVTQRLIQKLVNDELGVVKMDWYDKKVESINSFVIKLESLDAPRSVIRDLKKIIKKISEAKEEIVNGD